MDVGTRHSSKQSYMVMTLASVSVAGVLDRGNKLDKSSHSCGKLHYFYNDFVCEDIKE